MSNTGAGEADPLSDKSLNIPRSLLLALLLLPLASEADRGDVSAGEPINDELSGVAKWFAAWELVSTDVYGLRSYSPVDFVFFDDSHVYSTSRESVPEGTPVGGPVLFDEELHWRRASHDGSITLPDGQEVPVGLMSFAAPLEEGDADSFFVMPLPDFWESAGVVSPELGLENLLTGVFLHEFSHSQQMANFGRDISEFERKYTLAFELNDDIVQNYFQEDDRYVRDFRNEVALFYAAASRKDPRDTASAVAQAIDRLQARQRQYFNDGIAVLARLDELFLSMEGIGQYSMYSWLVHSAGANLDAEVAESGVRRGGRWWSQEEGLALYLVLAKLARPELWAPQLFGDETGSVIELLEAELAARQ